MAVTRMGGLAAMFPSYAAAAKVPQLTRVLLIAPYSPCGGGMGRIMEYLSACGTAACVRFEKVESRGGGSVVRSPWYVTRAALKIVRAAVSQEPTIIHLAFGDGGSIARKGLLLLLAETLGLPAIVHLHAANIGALQAGLSPVRRALMVHMFRRARHCIVLGPLWQAWLVDGLGVANQRVTVVRNGVPQPQIVCREPAAGVFTLVFLGNLLARKGIPDLLHALALMRLHAPAPMARWRLLVGGGGDPSMLRALAFELGVAADVRFLGWLDRPAVTGVLAQADALVLPSLHEALPLVLLEAASLGLPIIATRVGAVPEIFTDGRDALLVDPGDQVALAGTLNRLINDAAFSDYLGRNAKRLYEREFRMDAFVAGVAGVYARVSGANG